MTELQCMKICEPDDGPACQHYKNINGITYCDLITSVGQMSHHLYDLAVMQRKCPIGKFGNPINQERPFVEQLLG